MAKRRNIYSLLVANKYLHIRCLIFLLITASCSEDDRVPDLSFNILLNEVADFSATITVTHTGTNRVTYYAFAVQGENNDIDAEIRKHRNRILSGSLADEMYNQKKRVIKLSELMPETKYTCIVYGVGENDDVVGVPCSAVFKTSSSSIEFSVNPQWELTYMGQSKYDGKTYSKICIDVEGDIAERYFVRIYSTDVVDEYSDLRRLLLHAYNDFNKEQNDSDDEYFWVENNFVRTGSTNYYKYLFKGQYQAFAIGVDANGSLTGHYACSDIFDFDGYALEFEYADLLGDWEITDEVGGEIYLTLSERWANYTLSMSGFGYNDCPLIMNYTPSGAYFLTIPGQSALGCAWGDEDEKTMTLRAWYLNEDGDFRIYSSKIISTLARTKANDNGTLTFTPGFSINLNNGETATTTGVVLTFYDEDGKLHYYNSSKVQFPFTMRKID